MKKSLFSVVALLAVTTLVSTDIASAQRGRGRFGGGGRPSYDMLVSKFDKNGDGWLGKDEVPAQVWQRLSQADANGDGIVTREEFDSTQKKPSHANGKPSFETLTSAFDKNKDGILSKDEVPAQVWERLSKADTDKDEKVTLEEFNAYQPKGEQNGRVNAQRGGRPTFDTLLKNFDKNRDGALSKEEVPAPVWNRMAKADTNNNNVITREEYNAYQPGGH